MLPGAFLRLGQTPPVAYGDSPLKEGAFRVGKAPGSGAKLPVSPEPPSLREVANLQGLTEGVCPAVFLRLLAEMSFSGTTSFREKASPKRPQSFRRCKI